MKKVLLPIDVNKLTTKPEFLDRALDYVHDMKAELHLLTVIADYGSYFVSNLLPENFLDRAKAAVEEELSRFRSAYVSDELIGSVNVRHGVIYQEILAEAKEIDIDLILVIAGKPELADYVIGPTALRIARQAPCDVLIVRAGDI